MELKQLMKDQLSYGAFATALLGISWMALASNPAQTLYYAEQGEPPQLNSLKSTDQDSSFVLGHVMEGLVRVDEKGNPVPGVATDWKIDDKGVVFHLRKNAKWSDGKPVTARDFVFGWRQGIDPKTASEYAFMLYHVKNAEQIYAGKKPISELGVQAPDDTTLKVEFEQPCAYFVALMDNSIFFPIREDFYSQHRGDFGADASTLLYNGPFVLTKWVHGAELQMDKNPYYWGHDRIKLDRISIPYITPDNTARYNFFKDKKTDIYERISKEDIPRAQKDGIKIRTFAEGSGWFLEFNFRPGRLTTNLNLRKALRAVFVPDGEYISSVVGIPGTIPGRGFIPAWAPGVKTTWRKEFPIPMPKPNIAEAKKYLALAMKELGLSQPPSLTFLTQDTNFAAREAEYFQALFKKTLGIDIRIDKQIFKQRLAKMDSGDFDIVAAGWGPDYGDAMTFADLKSSWNGNNYGKYNNPAYDKLIRTAMGTTDKKKRVEAMAQAEKLMLDDVSIIPTYERIVAYLVQPWAKGIVRRGVGYPDPDFTGASIVGRP